MAKKDTAEETKTSESTASETKQETPQKETSTPKASTEDKSSETTPQPKEETKTEEITVDTRGATPKQDLADKKQELQQNTELTQEQRDQLYQEFKERQVKEQEEQKQANNEAIQNKLQEWRNEYSFIAKQFNLPDIKDSNDPNDPGMKEYRRIAQRIADLRNQGYDISTFSQAMLYDQANKQRSNNLPISGANTPQNDGGNYKHSKIRNSSFLDLAAEAANEK